MNQRDLELLSSYLDGQLKPSDSARLQARLSSNPDLRAVLDDLRSARGLLRQLPMRKAPRNFTLTPKMVRKNPPLPRAYPAFRFVTALATFLLFFTVGLNFLAPQMASQSPAFGMGGGGAPEVFSAQAPSPAATEAPVEEAPAAEPPAELAPMPTTTLATEDTAREAATPSEKNGVTGEGEATDQFQVQNAPATQVETRPPIPWTWPSILAGVALLSALIMLMMRRLAADRWRRKSMK
jgi:hypothetical protein